MATSTTRHRQIRRSGNRLVALVRLVLAVLIAAPFVALAVMGVDDWRHVGPQAVAGVSTSTLCLYDDLGTAYKCFGDFRSNDGTLVLRDVEVRLESEQDHTGPATAAPGGGSWVAIGAGGGRMVPLMVRQASATSLVWFIAYGATIVGLIGLVLLWTARQVGRAFGSVGRAPEVGATIEVLGRDGRRDGVEGP